MQTYQASTGFGRAVAVRSHSEIVAEFLGWLRFSKRCSELTLRSYRGTLAAWVEWVGTTPLDQVSTRRVEAFLERPRGKRARGGSPSAATMQSNRAVLRSFYRWCGAHGIVESDPTLLAVSPTVRNVLPKPIPDDQWIALWECGRIPYQDRVLLGLGFYGGLRRREISFLQADHFAFGPLSLVGFTRKGGGVDVTPLGRMFDVIASKLPHLVPGGTGGTTAWPELVASHVGRLAADERLVSQSGENYLNQVMDRSCARAGIAHLTPHQLRHSMVTNLLRAGVPLPMVSKLANHSNVQTTLRYAKLGGDELGEWLAGQ